jgi:hypothetical protein
MARTGYTEEQRARPLDLYREHGPGQASRRTGIPRATTSGAVTGYAAALVAKARDLRVA